MAIRTIAELKSFFQGTPTNDRPTAEQWTDLLDTIAFYKLRADAALASSFAVILVANESLMRINGPSYTVGQKIKCLDTEITYVKQQEPGTLIGEYAAIGDTSIQMAEVDGLRAALSDALSSVANGDSTDFRLGVANLATPVFGVWSYTPGLLTISPVFPALNYPHEPVDDNVTLAWTPADAAHGFSSTCFVQNKKADIININLDETNMVPTNGPWPISLVADQWVAITATFIHEPDHDMPYQALMAYSTQAMP
jgi:hypothetical protein